MIRAAKGSLAPLGRRSPSRFRQGHQTGLALVLSLSLAACAPVQGDPGAPHRRQGRDIAYYLNAEANVLTETAVRETFDGWDELTPFSFAYGGRHRAGLRKDGKNTVSFLTRWPAEIPIGQVAYCKNWYDRSGNIVESDIILNMQLARFTTKRTNKPESYYIEGVLSHEIGHLLGLGHLASSGSLMKEKSEAAESYFKGAIDRETLSAVESLYE